METRKINCSHCGKELVISKRAMSVNCSHCNQRVCVEDHVIDSYQAVTNIETSGTLEVTPNGHFRGRVRVQKAKVEGQVYGNITASGKVSLEEHARMVGDVTAGSLDVKEGARLQGFYCIRPQEPSPKDNKGR